MDDFFENAPARVPPPRRPTGPVRPISRSIPKGVKWAVVLGIVGAVLFIGAVLWFNYTSTPEYRAGKDLSRADNLRQDGKLGEAAALYRRVTDTTTKHAATAGTALGAMLDDARLSADGHGEEAVEVLTVVHDARRAGRIVRETYFTGRKLAETHRARDPENALKLIEIVEAEAPKPEDVLSFKRELLEKITADHPEQVEPAVKLAVVFERENHRERCEALLRRHEKELGDGEGARILGRILADQGKFEEAHDLLRRYADKHLPPYLEAARQLQETYVQVQRELYEQVNRGGGVDLPPEARFATDQQRQGLINEYVGRKMRESPLIMQKQDEVARLGVVVPVILDLGLAQLRRAQQLEAPAARKAELERAEKTFLSVQDTARKDPRYKLTLGQVYYWMGKQDQGKQLFDEMLADGKRNFEALYLVAHVLRDLGLDEDARALLEEAYRHPEAQQVQRYTAASLRALTAKDNDDVIAWLEKSDPQASQVRARLAEARGHKAMEAGRDEEAIRHFRDAVAIHEKEPENATTLNNAALSLLNLYEATGEKEPLEAALRKMEKAVSLSPRDSILQSNMAGVALNAALGEVIGDRIDLKKLKRHGSVALLRHLYDDQPGRDAITKRLNESAAIARARGYLDRAIVLAPKKQENYAILSELLQFMGDVKGMKVLADRADEVDLGPARSKQEVLDSYQGKNADRTIRELQSAAIRAERLVNDTRPGGGATFAVAACTLVGYQLGLDAHSRPVDIDAVVKLAEEAHVAVPSAATTASLEGALLARASRSLAGAEPEYAAMRRQAGSALSASDLVAVALWREGKPRDAALANVDVQRAVKLILDAKKKFPDWPDSWSWAMLRASHPDDALRVAEAAKKNEIGVLNARLQKRLYPWNVSATLHSCWDLDLAGKSADGLALLKRLSAEGFPLPIDLR